MQHQESQKLVARREEFKQERGAAVFSAEVITKIDKPGSKDRVHGIAILKVPEGESPEHFARKLEALSDRFVALPATQKCVSKCTLVRRVALPNFTSHLPILVAQWEELGKSTKCNGYPHARAHFCYPHGVRGTGSGFPPF